MRLLATQLRTLFVLTCTVRIDCENDPERSRGPRLWLAGARWQMSPLFAPEQQTMLQPKSQVLQPLNRHSQLWTALRDISTAMSISYRRRSSPSADLGLDL